MKILVKRINRQVQVVRVGRRGLQGETGPQGPKGDQGDPATNLVQSVNGKQGVVVLNATDVGADPTGSSAQALQDAKDYTDTEVSTLDSSLATVAKTGSYNDLSNKPAIPSIAGLATEAQVQDVQDNLDAHEADTANPHAVTKAQVGLSNVDNTSDANKPISTATQAVLDAKATTAALSAHANSTTNPHQVTKAQVGLGNVDNTSDANKPVSTATQAALNAKANASDTVNLTGNQTIAGVKTFSSSPIVPTATTTTQAVNKAQMETADALKVNKAGDTMTGQLANNANTLAYRLSRASKVVDYGLDSGGNFSLFNSTDAVVPFTVFVNNTGMLVGGVQYKTGTGFPEGVVTAPVGSIYIDTAITNGASSWIKKSGTGNTGWQVLDGTAQKTFTTNSGTAALRVQLNGRTLFYAFEGTLGATVTNPILTLPEGYRPSAGYSFLYGNGGNPFNKVVTVSANGEVYLYSAPTPSTTIAGTGSTLASTTYPTT